MSPQNRLIERDAPRDQATRLGKEHRRCHRLGDDFVGSAMSLANGGELLPWVRCQLRLSCYPLAGGRECCRVEGPTSGRSRSPLPASDLLGEELSRFSEPTLEANIKPSILWMSRG